ncbi:hypothetical protein HR058_27330 [Bacillus cereus]|nr:hypothetical protein [Bacillus cereus]NSL62338.1 hypothetical protein [Bacillus cereus]
MRSSIDLGGAADLSSFLGSSFFILSTAELCCSAAGGVCGEEERIVFR